MSNKLVQLEPKFLLDEDWKYSERILSLERAPSKDIDKLREVIIKQEVDGLLSAKSAVKGIFSVRNVGVDRKALRKIVEKMVEAKLIGMEAGLSEEEAELLYWIKSIRIEIAEASYTRKIDSDKKYDYLHSEIGMNIIVPKGNIAEMRFKVSLISDHRVVAIDGFPKDVIDIKNIVGGKIKLAISKAFMFIPTVGSPLSEFLDIELNPWEFKLGSLKKINIDFSGGLTSKPEWYFKEDGIQNDLRIALTIRKPKRAKHIRGRIKAAWLYDPGFLRRARLGTGAKSIKIF